jgi:hypothetical protein
MRQIRVIFYPSPLKVFEKTISLILKKDGEANPGRAATGWLAHRRAVQGLNRLSPSNHLKKQPKYDQKTACDPEGYPILPRGPKASSMPSLLDLFVRRGIIAGLSFKPCSCSWKPVTLPDLSQEPCWTNLNPPAQQKE